ncbi:hypothetical protein [Methylobacterium sp. GC_Met_2]|uniref:hypothetical protein n=1 Tax=Methylobacterium sp. GC_Met_2 TaxID=2937376 RepID=UPI00226B9581|nr:hypothetical protein [Methylobacterium sp. GC_Met_2]
MSLRTSLENLIRRDPAVSLHERAAATASRVEAFKPASAPSAPTHADQAAQAAEPDPALAVVTVFRASWDALGKVLEAEAPDNMVAELEDAQGAAYDRLRAARPTTPEGYRAMAECWAMVLKGHRGDEPGMMVGDHAADSLIAGAGVCMPVQAVDWYDPPPGFMGSPALEPSHFVQIPHGIELEIARLRSIAFAELRRRACPGTKVEDIRRIRRELHLETLSPSLPKSDILDQVDFAAADINELRALHERARELSNVAYAMSAMGCCENNAAGRLLHWLADELTTVEGKASAEMRSRQPTSLWDQRARLGTVAESIIENGDVTETATFIQELATWAAEQAQSQQRP